MPAGVKGLKAKPCCTWPVPWRISLDIWQSIGLHVTSYEGRAVRVLFAQLVVWVGGVE